VPDGNEPAALIITSSVIIIQMGLAQLHRTCINMHANSGILEAEAHRMTDE